MKYLIKYWVQVILANLLKLQELKNQIEYFIVEYFKF